MHSRTKLALTSAEVETLVRGALGVAEVSRVTELHGGTFNASFAVELPGRPALVLKVAPPPDLPLLTYERDLMRTEVEFFRRASDAGLRVPKVLFADFGRTKLSTDYFLMERLSGVPLDQVRSKLPAEAVATVRRQLGDQVARLRQVKGPHFGYLQPGAGAQAASWREAFTKMVSNVIDDATRFAVSLPRATDELRALFSRHAALLDAVEEPVLVHFDLWDGNVFVREQRLEAVIDPERAFYGDPVAEFVSVALFKEIDDEPDFLAGYREALGQPFELTAGLRTRLSLYRAYLYLVMSIEGVPRGYRGVKHFALRQLTLHKLRGELGRLERA